jgi:hypothetical protein
MLYLLAFYLPRFLNQSFEEKLTTIVHELWHISPAFDGDLRRHNGRCFAHGPSQREFDELAGRLARQWLSRSPPEELFAFLCLSFAELNARYGGIYGMRFERPKLLPRG